MRDKLAGDDAVPNLKLRRLNFIVCPASSWTRGFRDPTVGNCKDYGRFGSQNCYLRFNGSLVHNVTVRQSDR